MESHFYVSSYTNRLQGENEVFSFYLTFLQDP
jgi:hypothetical protein